MEANPEYGVALQPIDFATVARATGFTTDNPSVAEDTLRRALAHQNSGSDLEPGIRDGSSQRRKDAPGAYLPDFLSIASSRWR